MKSIEEFERAYESLGDALLRQISLSYETTENQPAIAVVLECMSALIDYEWVKLEMRFYDVQEYKILSHESSTICVVESFAASILDHLLVFNFAPNIIPPETLKEHQDSRFYIVCKSFDFKEIDF